jgi:hypothetical protein
VLVEVLIAVAVVLVPVPAFVVGCRGVFRRRGYSLIDSGDRLSFTVLVGLRLLTLLLVFALSGVTLVSCVGAIIRDLDLPNLVYVFFILDLLLAALILVTFGRRERRPARRRANPARR